MKKNLTLFLLCCAYIFSAQTIIFPTVTAWKYLDNGSNQGTAWYAPSFNDATWASGNAQLGYGDGDEATVINACGTVVTFPTCTNKYTTSYFRKTFNVASASTYTSYTMKFKRDDAIIVYMNGTEIYREGLPAGTITYTTIAPTACSDDGSTVFSIAVSASVIATGTNVIAVEIHQNGGSSSDVTFEMSLTGNSNVVTPTIVKGPYLQVGTQNSMIVRWESNVASDTKVMYGTNTASLTSVASSTDLVTAHKVQINGLSPYTKYYYSIGTSTIVMQGDAENYFLTSPTPGTAGKYRFWVIGDCGNASTNQINCKNQYKTFTGSTVTNAWLTLGDNAYSNGSDANFNAEFFGIYQNDVMKNMPLWPVPGNHDYNNGASTATTNPYFDFFSTPTNGEAGGVASNNPAYYSYDYGNVHFIALDSYGTTGASLKLYDTTGAQVTWLKQDLAANTKKWTIAYWHHPPYTMGSHNSDSEGDLAAIRQNFIRILERNKVDMIMCGHSHDYERSKLMNGHYGSESTFNASLHNKSNSSGLYDGSSNSCPYTKDSTVNKIGTVYVLSGSAGQLGGQQTSFPHDAMYYSDATNGGSFVLDVEDNKLEAKWVCADGVIRDKFTIFKDVKTAKAYTLQPAQATTLTASWPGSYNWSNGVTTRSISIGAISDTTVLVKDVNSCIADTFRLKILPAVNFSLALPPYCANAAVQLSDVSTNSTTAWSWSVTPSANFSNAGSKNPTITFSTSGTYTVSLIANNANGAGSMYSKTVTVNGSPTVSATSAATAVCASQTISLTASGASTYSWNTGATTSTISITPANTAVYTVTGTDAIGCKTSATQTITVNALPVIALNSTPANAQVCTGNTLVLNGSGAATYTITNAGVNNGAAFTPAANTTYTVTGTDINGCQNTATKSVTINTLPTLTLTATPANAQVCAGNTVVLNGSGAATYTIINAGVTNGSAFTPAANTTYTVTGTDSSGCQNTATKSVTVNALPALTLVANPANAQVCAGNTVVINGSGAATYTILNAGVTNGTAFTPAANATYTITGTDTNGCQNTATKSVTVNALPALTLTANPANAQVCAGNTLILSGSGAATYTIANAGVINGTAFTPAANTTYTVTGTDTNGCQNTATKSVTINALPTLTVTANPANATVCNGSTLALLASGATTYTWSNAVTNGASFTINGNAAYTVTGTNASGCINTITQTVTANASPVLTVTGNSSACAGQTAAITVSGANTYSWNTGSTASAITVTPATTTIYTVTGTSANNCQTTVLKTVTVNALPSVSAASNPSSAVVCAGSTITLNGAGATTYSWSNGITNGAAFIVSANTTYTVTGTDANGCQNTAVKAITTNPLPVISITGNATLCAGQSTTLTAAGAVSYAWSNGDNGANLVITPLAGFDYLVTGTDANGCKNSTGTHFMVNALPAVLASTSNEFICAGQSATLTASGASGYNWSSSETTPVVVITPSASTSYTVTGNDANGCANKATVTQNVSECTALKTNSVADKNITVYPNPNQGVFTIDVNLTGDLSVTIANTLGETVYSGKLNTGANNLSLTAKHGVYFYTILNNKKPVSSGKLIVE